jgi:hypothetical protein
VRVFIGVSDHTCINICVCIMFKKIGGIIAEWLLSSVYSCSFY